MVEIIEIEIETSAFSYSAKCANSRPAWINNQAKLNKLLDLFYQNKKGLNGPKNFLTLLFL